MFLSWGGTTTHKTQTNKQKKQANNEVLSKRRQQPQLRICKIAAGEAHSGKTTAARRLSKPQFAALPVCKSTSTARGRGRALHARGSPKWHRDVLFSCFYLNVCIGKQDLNLKKKSRQAQVYFPVLTFTSAENLIIGFLKSF